jgi:hypothetical protein
MGMTKWLLCMQCDSKAGASGEKSWLAINMLVDCQYCVSSVVLTELLHSRDCSAGDAL